MNLVFQIFQFFFYFSDSFLHLRDERLRILGHCKETDVVLVSIQILLELVVLLYKPVFLGLALA